MFDVISLFGISIACGLVFGAIWLTARAFRRTRKTQTMWCPVHQVPLRVHGLRTIGTASKPGHAVDVSACEIFAGQPVTCSKTCLQGASIFQRRQQQAGAASIAIGPVSTN